MYNNNYDEVFLSYNKILKKLRMLNLKTKKGKDITHQDLRYVIDVMVKKHPSCRWKSIKFLFFSKKS